MQVSGYRYYSPSLGRWANRDPIEEEGGEALHGFVLNNPVSFIDPEGKVALVDCMLCAAAFSGEIWGTAAGCAWGCWGAVDYGDCLWSCVTSQYSPCELWTRLRGNPAAWAGAVACISCGATAFAALTEDSPPDDCCPDRIVPDPPPRPVCPPCQPYPAGTKLNKKTDTKHDHAGCLALTGSKTHWHFDIVRQNQRTCRCFVNHHEDLPPPLCCGQAPPPYITHDGPVWP